MIPIPLWVNILQKFDIFSQSYNSNIELSNILEDLEMIFQFSGEFTLLCLYREINQVFPCFDYRISEIMTKNLDVLFFDSSLHILCIFGTKNELDQNDFFFQSLLTNCHSMSATL